MINMKDLFSAISFLTIVPIKSYSITFLTTAYFPFVGLILGAILFLLDLILEKFLLLPREIVVGFVLVIYIILTGGFHLDGLSDTVDGISASIKDKTKILLVMSDSHIGAEGVVAIVCDILLKFVLLYKIPVGIFQNILLIFPVISRYCMVVSMFFSKPAKPDGLGKLFIENTNMKSLAISTIVCVIVAMLFFNIIVAIAMIVFSVLVVIITTKFLTKKIGGMTGDSIGAINEIAEITILSVFIILNSYRHNF